MKYDYDAIVVGSGPNGFAAAITVAEHGGSVLLLEGSETLGGGMRSSQLTSPGFVHDVCSAVHPLALASPFFKKLPLARHGLEWIFPPSALAHPLDDGRALLLEKSLEATASGLGHDAFAYRNQMEPFLSSAEDLIEEILKPLLHIPRHPLLLARFGLNAIQPANHFAKRKFKTAEARALFAGCAAHSMIPLSSLGSSAIALVLMLAGHKYSWPIPKGGSASISRALALYLKSLGGEIRTEASVRKLEDLPSSRWVFLDVTPHGFAQIAENKLTESQKRALSRFKFGMGVFKIDFALSSPIPWAAPECSRAATVHVGGTLEEIEKSEAAACQGKTVDKPFVLLAQPSLFDDSRAPKDKHTVWAYCHVPLNSPRDYSAEIENQIERFAPGFRKKIVSRCLSPPASLERYNPNYVGGDISAGSMNFKQVLFRPRVSFSPYATSIPGVYLCSASTPPGPGVHGMCGYLAARTAII